MRSMLEWTSIASLVFAAGASTAALVLAFPENPSPPQFLVLNFVGLMLPLGIAALPLAMPKRITCALCALALFVFVVLEGLTIGWLSVQQHAAAAWIPRGLGMIVSDVVRRHST